MRAIAIVLVATASSACSSGPAADLDASLDAGVDASPDAGAADAGDPALYPADPRAWTAATCAADQAATWTYVVPARCAGAGVCSEAGRTYRDGAPWIVRGLYGAGADAERALAACAAGAPCAATQPADRAAYVRALGDAGFDVVLEHVAALSPELRAALAADPRVGLAPPLFGDPFTMAGHDALAAEVDAAVADPDVLLFFGPDEPDLNHTWPMATGIARLLRGSTPAIDALLVGRYRPPTPTPYLPATEPAHAPGYLYASAVVDDTTGLAVATDVYDAILPVTYPFQEPYSRADAGEWSITRTATFARAGVPSMPVLQMIGIDSLGLIRPTPGQIRAEIVGSLVEGAAGAFYFQLASDAPAMAGRTAFYAPDDVPAWSAYAESHALWDRLVPVLYGAATIESGTADPLIYRRFTLGDRRVVLLANPTPYDRVVDLDTVLSRAPGEAVRNYGDCTPFTTRVLDVPGYWTAALEVVPLATPVPAAPGDPLAGHRRTRPAPTPQTALSSASWETLPPLPVGRSAHAGAWLAADGTLALLGGYAGSNDANAFDARYALDGTITAGGTLAVPTASAASALFGGELVIAGGVPTFSTTAPVVPSAATQCFRAGAWAACAPVGDGPVSSAAFADDDGALYLAGGYARRDPAGDLVTNVLQRYVAADDRWLAESTLPEPRVLGAALVANGVLYVVGGQTFSGASGTASQAHTVLAYDLVERRWLAPGDALAASDLPTPRAALACAMVGGYGYCLGGYDAAGNQLATVERLDPTDGSWSTAPSLPEPLSDTVAVAADGALVVAGGLTAAFADGTAVYRLR